jgi:MerR family transcriptional regulator, thiopeptide resistance regulator
MTRRAPDLSKFYHIHEFAELAGVTVKALHHYDRLGLLKPQRTDAGYRLYTERDLERLEQIVALKFLGLPLKPIKVVLDRAAIELPEVLRLQRTALEQKRQLLTRAISAIREAEKAITPGQPADPAILKKLIEVINMQNDMEAMKQYYGEEAWAKRRLRFERDRSNEWNEWKDLYRDVETALGEDPAGEKAQALASRWMTLVERDSGGDPEVVAGGVRAWADRQNWPASLRHSIATHNVEAIAAFIGKAIAAHRRKYFDKTAWEKLSARSHEESDRLSAAWHELFQQVGAALGDDPASERAQALAARWMELAEQSTCGDPDIKAGTIKAWIDRRSWPDMSQRYLASVNLERIAEFIGKANTHRLRKQGSPKKPK